MHESPRKDILRACETHATNVTVRRKRNYGHIKFETSASRPISAANGCSR